MPFKTVLPKAKYMFTNKRIIRNESYHISNNMEPECALQVLVADDVIPLSPW